MTDGNLKRHSQSSQGLPKPNHNPSLAASSGMALLLAAILVAIMALIVAATAVGAAECQREPDNKGSWTWRYIEPHAHTRCWYRGRQILPKSALHWSSDKIKPAEKPRPVKMDLPPTRAADDDVDVDDATECCWPQLATVDASGNIIMDTLEVPSFEIRWSDVPQVNP